MREFIKKIPVIRDIVYIIYRKLRLSRLIERSFPGSEKYWQNRYNSGGNSGSGSYGKLAEFKAEVINSFVIDHGVKSVIEFGCGDGNQLMLSKYPKYFGFDISDEAIRKCKKLFEEDSTKVFDIMANYSNQTADLALSLDVIYHLVEDKVFENYMNVLFAASNKNVIIYSSDFEDDKRCEGMHVRHRAFSKWVSSNLPEWELAKYFPNKYPDKGKYQEGSFADFFIYKKKI
ncbi:MAG: class I SAM-dependent methyltransferase [Candidatus Omnitrophica bacterium]|nr:class I SAM-dependent methyltransferase [Candidatus Omnitrophota bacterium]